MKPHPPFNVGDLVTPVTSLKNDVRMRRRARFLSPLRNLDRFLYELSDENSMIIQCDRDVEHLLSDMWKVGFLVGEKKFCFPLPISGDWLRSNLRLVK